MKKVGKLQMEWMGEDEDEFAWDDFMFEFNNLVKVKNFLGFWYVEVKNFGWMKQDAHKYLFADDGLKVIHGVLPDTDNHFKVYNWGKGLAIQNFHHDSPTGLEWYYLKPISEQTYDRES